VLQHRNGRGYPFASNGIDCVAVQLEDAQQRSQPLRAEQQVLGARDRDLLHVLGKETVDELAGRLNVPIERETTGI
jgi:hypothetical protein